MKKRDFIIHYDRKNENICFRHVSHEAIKKTFDAATHEISFEIEEMEKMNPGAIEKIIGRIILSIISEDPSHKLRSIPSTN